MKLDKILSSVLMEDPNNGQKGYKVRSLYFDTINEKNYEEKDTDV